MSEQAIEKEKPKHGTADLGEDQVKFFDNNDINVSRWIRKRIAEWIAEAKRNPQMIEDLKADDDREDNVKRGRTLVHKTLSVYSDQTTFFKENNLVGKQSLLMRRIIDRFMDAVNEAEKSMKDTTPPQQQAEIQTQQPPTEQIAPAFHINF